MQSADKKESFFEKLKLLFIGSIFSAFVAVSTVLVTSYFNDYALRAETQADKNELDKKIEKEKATREKEIALLKNDLNHLKNGQTELKDMLKTALRDR